MEKAEYIFSKWSFIKNVSYNKCGYVIKLVILLQKNINPEEDK